MWPWRLASTKSRLWLWKACYGAKGRSLKKLKNSSGFFIWQSFSKHGSIRSWTVLANIMGPIWGSLNTTLVQNSDVMSLVNMSQKSWNWRDQKAKEKMVQVGEKNSWFLRESHGSQVDCAQAKRHCRKREVLSMICWERCSFILYLMAGKTTRVSIQPVAHGNTYWI